MSLHVKEIRGNVNSEITNEFASILGNRIGIFLSPKTVVNVGKDNSPTSQMISQSLTSGILAAGINVNDYGVVPLPVIHYLSNFENGDIQLNVSTDQNKIAIKVYSDYKIHLEDNQPSKVTGNNVGQLKYVNKYLDKYQEAITKTINNLAIQNKRPKVLLECGNNSIMPLITQILDAYGVDRILFNCETSNREDTYLESRSENLSTLSDMVKTIGADIGISLDNEVDKAVFMDENGQIIRDQTMLGIFAKNGLKNNPGVIVSSVVSSLALEEVVKQANGKLIKSPVDSVLTESAKYNAIFAGDEPGNFVFPSFQSCSDPIFASMMLLKIISENKPLSKLAHEIPEYHRTGFTVKCDHENKCKAIELFKDKMKDKGYVDNTDGIRADFKDSFILVRPSRFEPLLKIYIETKDSSKLSELNNEVNDIIEQIKN
ncbi:MAG: hypothetical protein NKF70_13945 [Methanobacterium sp. ERen5]|nr:MAG: hypothetical protein NKF70_13945 [Methanobacterium sp. ERen5]